MRSHRLRLVAALAAAAAVIPPSLFAQGADALLRDFEPSGEYVFVLDGKPLPNAEVYRSVRAAAFLVIASELESPVLLSPGLQRAETVNLMKVMKQPDGTVDLLADAGLASLGALKMEGEDVSFNVGGKKARLTAKPPLLGWRSSTELLAHDAGYVRRAKAYTPEKPAVEALLRAEPARVVVFFGSWCPHCSEYLPRLLRAQQDLAGSRLQFEFYGLPKGSAMSADPQAKKQKISFVPQAVIYRGEQEIGRLSGNDWSRPERSLQALLTKGPESASR